MADVLDGLRNDRDESLFQSLKLDLHTAIPSLQVISLAPVAILKAKSHRVFAFRNRTPADFDSG